MKDRTSALPELVSQIKTSTLLSVDFSIGIIANSIWPVSFGIRTREGFTIESTSGCEEFNSKSFLTENMF